MRIVDIRSLSGRNFYAHFPVVRLEIDLGSLRDTTTAALPHLTSRLMSWLPGLAEHHCGLGTAGGFLSRLQEGTYLGHVLEHVALELQSAAGWPVSFGKTRSLGEDGRYVVAYEYVVEQVGVEAGRMALQMLQAGVSGQDFAVAAGVQALQRTGARFQYGPSTMSIVQAARRRGIPVTRLDQRNLIQLGYGCHAMRLAATITGRTPCVAVDIAQDKMLTKTLLEEAGIPVPRGEVVRDEEEAVRAAQILGYPVVVKPLAGSKGRGVSLDLRSPSEVATAFRLAAEVSDEVLVEKFVPGRQYRLLVVGGRVVAAAERVPARVMGDGRHSIGELIERENENPWRGEGHEKPLTRIRVDPLVVINLARHGLTLDSVPHAGEVVLLRRSANLSTGGTAHDVTGEMHPENASLAVRAVRVVGLDVAGVDVVAPRLSWPIRPGQGAVVEVNAAPGLRMHLYPTAGRPRDVGKDIVEWLYPPGRPCRVPIVAVTGSNGKTTVCRLLAHILRCQGRKVGLATTDSLMVGETIIRTGDCAGPRSARALLCHPEVEVAVLETARGGILREGLAFDYCQVGVVTNLQGDHVGQDEIRTLADLAHLKSLVLETVARDGFSLLNFADPASTLLAERCRGRRAWFGACPPAPGDPGPFPGEPALYPRRGWLTWFPAWADSRRWSGRSGESEPVALAPLREIPITLGGTVVFNVANVAAAALAALCLGVDVGHIRSALRSFRPEANPGRLQVFPLRGRHVVVDYGHNPAALGEVAGAVRRLLPSPVGAVIASPGDRADAAIVELGRVAGSRFDWLVVKEDADRRGRATGEVARLLCQGAQSAERGTALRVEVVLEEAEAVRRALQICPPGGTVVVFYEKYAKVVGVVEEWAGRLSLKDMDAVGENA